MISLQDLGPRICILGPSNSGKSTLAAAISSSRGLPPIFIDQLHHLPNTHWTPRPTAEFEKLHDEAIDGAHWVIEGTYKYLLSNRLDRATGVILLEVSIPSSLLRYFRRCWFKRSRVGGLEGGVDTVNWGMLRSITVGRREKRQRNLEIFDTVSVPKIRLDNTSELDAFYRVNGLRRWICDGEITAISGS